MHLKKDFYINVFSTCILVKGLQRGTINDLQRGKMELVPNELIDLLNNSRNKKVSEVFNNYNSKKDKLIIEEYFEFLVKNEIIYLSKEKEFFVSDFDGNYSYSEPRMFLTSILDINVSSKYCIKNAILEIDKLGCDNIQLRIYDFKISINKLNDILDMFLNTSFRNVELLLMYDEINIQNIKNILDSRKRVSLVYFHSYEREDKIEEGIKTNYIFTSEKILSSEFCGYITPFYFNISPITYFIGEKYNTCIYKKISIDVDGNVKNCPSMSDSFGKIDNINLKLVTETFEFQKLWDITKDKINVCKSCEFRKICTDCRAYLHDPKDIYSKPKKCNYNPKTAIWKES